MNPKPKLIDLEKLKKDMEEIAGSWNGENSQFTCGGILYEEEDADAAQEIADLTGNLIDALETFSGGKTF